MRTITSESKSPQVCCKFLEVREIKLSTQPLSVSTDCSPEICPPQHAHIHTLTYTCDRSTRDLLSETRSRIPAILLFYEMFKSIILIKYFMQLIFSQLLLNH